MTARLIYHDPDSEVSQRSVFDEVVTGMVSGQDVVLVSPYIGLALLEKIAAKSRSWRLITDITEWMRNTNPRLRSKTQRFIKINRTKIRYQPDIHAKVVATPSMGLVGSANLTESGFAIRTELSVLLEDKTNTDELLSWFEEIWNVCNEINLDELESVVSTPPRPNSKDTSKPANTAGFSRPLATKKKQKISKLKLTLDTASVKDLIKKKEYLSLFDSVAKDIAQGDASVILSFTQVVRHIRYSYPDITGGRIRGHIIREFEDACVNNKNLEKQISQGLLTKKQVEAQLSRGIFYRYLDKGQFTWCTKKDYLENIKEKKRVRSNIPTSG